MTLSTRIAVMDRGRFTQIGPPAEVYEYPRNRFTAGFVGKINLFEGRVEAVGEGQVTVRCDELARSMTLRCEQRLAEGATVCVAVRPEKIYIAKEPAEDPDLVSTKGTVFDLGYFGNVSLYRVRIDGDHIIEVSAQNRQRDARRRPVWDDEVYLSWHVASAVLLPD